MNPRDRGLGDCVDCKICVQVCPTGIDIRKGLQYECIGCAACIDGCDQVMDRMGYPRGLIRYATQNALSRGLDGKATWRRTLRPRTLIYAAMLLAIIGAAVGSLAMRNPLKIDVIRDRGALARDTAPGVIENVYRLQLMNTDEARRRYVISASGLPGLKVVGVEQPIELGLRQPGFSHCGSRHPPTATPERTRSNSSSRPSTTARWYAMSHRASSFPTERPIARWFREPWPWLLMAGPFVVVVASMASAWIAFATSDGLVADDYYKQGLLINRRLAAIVPERSEQPAATISLSSEGEVRVHLERGSAPSHLRVTLARPGERGFREVVLSLSGDGDWIGRDTAPSPGRLIIKLVSDLWELPVMTTASRPSQIRVRAAAGRS